MKTLPPVDSSVRVPAAVARLAMKADELQKAAMGIEDTPEPPAEPPAADPVPPEPPAPVAPSLQPPPAEPPASQPQPDPVPPAAEEEDWKRKFERSQGQLRAAQKTNTELSERIGNLERTLAVMHSQPAPAPAPAAPSPATSLITPEDIETYGPEFFDAVKRAAQEMIAPVVADYEAKLTQLGSQVGSVATVIARDATEVMKQRITSEVPNWLEINKDETFVEWLQEHDLLTGNKRHDMLLDAWNKNDGLRVSHFFKTFLREQAAIAEPSRPDPSPSAPVVSLGAFAAPGKAKGSTPPKDGLAKQPISRADIAAFYADVNTGKYRNRVEDQKNFEREIFAAQAEGRITQ